MVAGMHVAAHAVLGRVEGYQVDARSLVEYVDCRFQFVVDARRVGDKAHALALQGLEAAVAEHLDAGLYLCRGYHCGQGAEG